MSKQVFLKKEIPIILNPIDHYDIIVSIHSLLSLKDGWSLKYTNKGYQTYLDKMTKKSCIVGIVGNSNSGKTNILQTIAGSSLPIGFSINTEGLSVKYPTIDSKNIILLDSAGFETPLKRNASFSDSIEDSMDPITLYNYLVSQVRDKQLTDLFIQRFVLFHSDIIITVVNQLTYTDQKLISRIKADYLYKKRQSKQKILFVIHNLLYLESIEQVEQYIEDTLLKSLTFKLIENTMINWNKDKKGNGKGNQNCKYYIEQIQDENHSYTSIDNVIHLIMAKNDTEAGNYYNMAAIDFLRSNIVQYTHSEEFPLLDKIKEHLFNLSKSIIENPIRLDDIIVQDKAIKLSLIRDRETGEKSKSNSPIRLNKCFIDEIGVSMFIRNHFTPTYSYYISNDSKLLVIEIEICGTVIGFNAKMTKISKYYCFQISGEKVIGNEPNEGTKRYKATREEGKFLLDIIIPASVFFADTKAEVKHVSKKGIWMLSYPIELNDPNQEESVDFLKEGD